MGWIRNRRRRKLRARPFPGRWRALLAEHAPFLERFPPERRAKFEGDLQVFESEKTFIGAGGFDVTEEVRVVVAASAVRLVAFLDIGYFDRLREIVMYPAAFRRPDDETVFLGEVSHWSTVVLSWEDVLAGLRDPHDGRDTASHEFAHVLDREAGAFDGTPTLRAREDYAAWARVLSEHYLRLRAREGKGRPVLRDYAATNEAEFFAVATEVFFERPGLMRKRAPDLYAELRRFYGFDPKSGGRGA